MTLVVRYPIYWPKSKIRDFDPTTTVEIYTIFKIYLLEDGIDLGFRDLLSTEVIVQPVGIRFWSFRFKSWSPYSEVVKTIASSTRVRL